MHDTRSRSVGAFTAITILSAALIRTLLRVKNSAISFGTISLSCIISYHHIKSLQGGEGLQRDVVGGIVPALR